ncbi:MAG TPA: ABC transporter ATP-binding protein, partial [Candidatus Acetothermia bacterium]|nr:ABC transporter ATP-binding protein [Candidatus Acetothermia bacterium]
MTDHFETDDVMGKAFDAQLMRRLLRFLKPYRLLFVVCVVLTITLAGIELAIPYISKTAIDSYMTLSHSVVELPAPPEEGSPIDLGEGRYLVETLTVHPETRREWELAGLLRTERFLFVAEDAEEAVYADQYPDVFQPVPGGWMASNEDLKSLPARDLEALRGGSISGILRLAFLFGFILVSRFVFGVLQVYLLQYTGQLVMYDMRREILGHV